MTSTLSESGVYVTGIVNHQQMSIMLDTGSTVSVVSEKMWKKSGTNGVNLKPVCGTLTTANGSAIIILGETAIRLRIGNTDVNFPMIVAQNISHDCLLGTNFLRKYCCRIMYDTGTFVIQGSEVPIHYEKQAPSVCRITLHSATTIPPGTEVLTEGHLPPGYEKNYGSPGIIEEAKSMRKNKEICLARAMVVPRNGTALIRLANFTDKEICLQENEVVGQFHPLDHTRVMVHSKDSEELESNSPNSTKKGTKSSHVPAGASVKDNEWYKELKVEINELTQDQELKFFETIQEYEDVFAKDETDIGLSHLMEHEINTGDHKPIKQQPRRLPPHRRPVVEKQLDSLLSQGRIAPSNSPWSSPVVLVRKRDGDFRMCIDYRKLNAITTRDAQPLPRVDDILESLDGACYFTCLDLASGYWQVKVAEKDRAKTAFVTPQGQFEWLVMPFGLTNAPGTFQRLMNMALQGLTWKYCLVYLDDILIWSKSFDEHLNRLRAVFERLRAAGVKLKPKKCHFLKKRVNFLGHVISSNGIETDPEKITALHNWPTPKNIKELRSFLRLAGYYRKFIMGFSMTAEPLYRLLKRNCSFQWSKEQENAFQALKQHLCSPPCSRVSIVWTKGRTFHTRH